jgi:hypothetical protein
MDDNVSNIIRILTLDYVKTYTQKALLEEKMFLPDAEIDADLEKISDILKKRGVDDRIYVKNFIMYEQARYSSNPDKSRLLRDMMAHFDKNIG